MPTTYAIPNGATAFNVSLWTGNNTPRSITTDGAGNALQLSPEFIWGKSIGSSSGHLLYDVARGVNKSVATNSTAAQDTASGQLTSFDSNGFTLPADTAGYLNYNNRTYVGWLWEAGGAPTTDNVAGAGNVPTAGSAKVDGSNMSTALAGTVADTRLSVNTAAGFSVATFTAPASGNFSVGHGLGTTPGMVVTKVTSRAGTSWVVWHNQLNGGSPGTSYYLQLDTTVGTQSYANVWGSTGVTSSVIGLGVNAAVGANDVVVAYSWAEIAGYSKAFSYVGNSSSDGAFVYLGFRPRYILHKNTASSQWMIWDTSRSPYNVLTNQELLANSANAQGTGSWGTEIDILSNGFKFRGSDNANFNYSGNTYIGFAFAENPFKYANAR